LIARGDVVLPALLIVQDVINRHVTFQASPGLFWDRRSLRPEAGIRPPRLVDFLWWQFAEEVSRSVSFRPCQTCGGLIRIGQGTRADRFYCSHACRLRGYRQRKPLARALAAKGKTVEEIAHELGADPPVVMRWVSD
jgi:hypothetical protein